MIKSYWKLFPLLVQVKEIKGCTGTIKGCGYLFTEAVKQLVILLMRALMNCNKIFHFQCRELFLSSGMHVARICSSTTYPTKNILHRLYQVEIDIFQRPLHLLDIFTCKEVIDQLTVLLFVNMNWDLTVYQNRRLRFCFCTSRD